MDNHLFGVKTICIVAMALLLGLFSGYPVKAQKLKSPEELRKEMAARAAKLLKRPPGGVWKATAKEALEALKLKGDPQAGEDIYHVCAACHQPTAWGDPLGVFPQLAGQHATVLIKQIADIRAGNRDNPTMYPFAMQIKGAQDIRDVCTYIQTLPMNPHPYIGPGGPSYILSNMRKEVWPISLDRLQKVVGDEIFKRLKTLEEKEFRSKEKFLAAVKAATGSGAYEKYKDVILQNANWSTDLQLGKKLYEKHCVKCHGDHGQGNWRSPLPKGMKAKAKVSGKGGVERGYFPVLAGQNYLYMIRQFSWIQIGKRRNANPDMIREIQNFSFLDFKSVCDYASRFKMRKEDYEPVEAKEEGWEFLKKKKEEEEESEKPAFLQ